MVTTARRQTLRRGGRDETGEVSWERLDSRGEMGEDGDVDETAEARRETMVTHMETTNARRQRRDGRGWTPRRQRHRSPNARMCHFIRECRTRMRDMEQQTRQGGNNNQASASTSNSNPILPSPGAIVPYKAPSQDVRNNQGSGSSNGGYNGDYNAGYGSYYNNNYRRPWYSDQRDKNERVEKMCNWMSGEMEERERIKKEKEEAARKEEAAKKEKEIEEKKLAEAKEKEDFKESIGRMVQSQMRYVCEEVLGRKVGEGERLTVSTAAEIRRRTEAEILKSHESEEIQKKDEEILKLKKAMADLQSDRTGIGFAEAGQSAPDPGRSISKGESWLADQRNGVNGRSYWWEESNINPCEGKGEEA
ncbi:hypothetical protein CBR_g30546 [Chara braunii]|uniref:Uncharacterized protein n=1 Tax=Chara braunii TaxID=69332 RepID=A0A388LD01_CHABU|nr:hypothetical protein CBR_g30546 [Chara braunii]|eukprot:GBG80180.1 hypothetical protein CBR_g30546 [Chara braunii]